MAALRDRLPHSRPLVEVLVAFAGVTLLAATLYRVRALDAWFHIIIACLFLYLPVWLLRRHDLARYGFTTQPLGASLALVAVLVLVCFPPFFFGFALWQHLACALPPLRSLAPVACGGGSLLSHFVLRLPPNLANLHLGARLWSELGQNLLLAELVVVALPEEFFFRGYVQGRLEEAWAPRRRFLGAPVGAAWLLSAALFAACHVAVQGNFSTAAVFFPGLLFGWMRARTGSILPGVIFHCLCNIYIETLNRSFGG